MSVDPKQPENVTPAAGGGWVSAALALACGQSGPVAAAAAGVDPRTIKRWRKKPHFQALVEDFRKELLAETLGRLLERNTAAVDALAGLLNDPQGSVRLGAASRLLTLTMQTRRQLRDESELAGKIEELERIVKELVEHDGAVKSSQQGA